MSNCRIATAVKCASLLLALMLSVLPLAAQNYSVIHSFRGSGDGAFPLTGVTISPGGQIYGTTRLGYSYGNVYNVKNSGGTWTVTNLYAFHGGTDGQAPLANVIIGRDGALFGTTSQGGDQNCYGFGCGTVFKLQPQPHFMVTFGGWKETQLTHFEGNGDGANPVGNLTFDAEGNLYGAAACEYNNCPGIIFKLTPSGGSWTRSIIYSFAGGIDGSQPLGGVTFGPDGNLYGVTLQGGIGNGGTVFELIRSGSGWTKSTLHNFATTEGTAPFGGLYIDSSGTLYGTTTSSGLHNVGSFFIMAPDGHGGWSFSTPVAFSCSGCYTTNYPGPQSRLPRTARAISTAPPTTGRITRARSSSSRPTAMAPGAIPACMTSPAMTTAAFRSAA